MEKIGIFGGTFNPIHNGHKALAQHYIEALELDRLLVIPTAAPPHKQAADLLSGRERLLMCQLAFEDVPKAQLCDIEIRRQGKSYTVDTLRELTALYPEARFYLLCGSDMFLTFTKWREWKKILSKVTLCTAARDAGELQKLTEHEKLLSRYGQTKVFDFPVLRLSSTQIRQHIREKQDCSELLPPGVWEHIRKNNLYRG